MHAQKETPDTRSENSSSSNLDETCAMNSGKLQSPLIIDDPTPIETASLSGPLTRASHTYTPTGASQHRCASIGFVFVTSLFRDIRTAKAS